jgi:DNA-binding MarR family transcriptional regulator
VTARLSDTDYATLLAFRVELRRFLRWSGSQAALVGLTATQHQLLLAVRGHPDTRGPTITDVAGYLLVRHHSAVELVDRAEAAGLVERRPDTEDLRVVRLVLTPAGSDKLDRLSVLHVEELRRLSPWLAALTGLGDPGSS